MKSLLVLSLLSLLLLSNPALGQPAPMKFGKINLSDLQMKYYEKDSSASAVILCDYGVSKIEYAHREGWKLVTEVHRRIKILKKDGYEWADGEIYLYNQYGDKEKLNYLKGYTYNLQGKKIVKSKLEKSSIFEEKYSSNRDVTKFTMPDVKEGSVLEYSYIIVSDFLFNFDDWEFQSSIPVVWSEFRSKIPEYFIYKVVPQGFLPFHVATSEMRPQNVTIAEAGTAQKFGAARTESSVNLVSYREENKIWVVKDAPKFEKESFMTSSNNYISKVSYELAFIKEKNSPEIDYMGSWDKLNRRFLEASYFGEHLFRAWKLSNPIKDLPLEGLSDEEKIAQVYGFVKSKVSWNGENRCTLKTTGDYSLKNPLSEGKGSAAEVNLILTTLLRKAGLRADPVILSTRNHGIVKKDFPMMDQFNYVICKVYIGDQYMLLDATDPYLPINTLPERCLNGSGFAISKDNPGWVNVTSKAKKSTKISGALVLDDEGMITGNLKYAYGGYSARIPRKEFLNSGEQTYVDNKMDNSPWEVNSLDVENAKDLSQSFTENYDLEIESDNSGGASIIYISPMFDGKQESNPFKLEERKYPVDFGSTIEEMYYVTIEIPDGYVMEQSPTPLALALPEKSGNYKFQVTQLGNKLTVYSKLAINKIQFSSNEYAYLKEFFAQIISKQNEQIVLKKS
ncbi:MAG: DUF3857 domain-containing protein [Reichenbachiella sp.]|uniref:DUF3857 domain-containing protein n=1 Tax=Reichenbachiella sp. TaxID=2184521 RepID=UPI003267DED8